MAIFAAHVPAPLAAVGLSHHLPGQSTSVVHCDPHAPEPGLHTVPACEAPVHWPFDVQRPHEPSPAQKGLALVGQGLAPVTPLSTVHPTQTCVVVLQMGLVPVHAAVLVLVQATH